MPLAREPVVSHHLQGIHLEGAERGAPQLFGRIEARLGDDTAAFDAAAGDDLHRGTRVVERDHACVGRDADVHRPGADERHVVGEGRRRDEFQNNTIRRRDLPRVSEEQREAAEAGAIRSPNGGAARSGHARAKDPARQADHDRAVGAAPQQLAAREQRRARAPQRTSVTAATHDRVDSPSAAVRPGETRPASMLASGATTLGQTRLGAPRGRKLTEIERFGNLARDACKERVNWPA